MLRIKQFFIVLSLVFLAISSQMIAEAKVKQDHLNYRSNLSNNNSWEDAMDLIMGDTENFFNFLKRSNENTKLELYSEYYAYDYEQPDFLTEEGEMYSIGGKFSHRLYENPAIKSFWDALKVYRINYYEVDGRVAFGQVDYDGKNPNDFLRSAGNQSVTGTGTADDLDNLVFEIRGIVGYDIPFSDSTVLMPYVGGGYRYLKNEFDQAGLTSTGQLTYLRETSFFYLPLGLQLRQKFSDNWSVTLNAEFDWMIAGKHKSDLGEGGLTLTSGTTFETYLVDQVENELKDGYGLRASVNIEKRTEYFDFFVEPFIRFWDIDNSESEQISSLNGSLVWVFGTPSDPVLFTEPENQTLEYGIKAGIKY